LTSKRVPPIFDGTSDAEDFAIAALGRLPPVDPLLPVANVCSLANSTYLLKIG